MKPTGAKEQNYNLPIYELDRWQKPGDVTDVPRFVLWPVAGPVNSSPLCLLDHFT